MFVGRESEIKTLTEHYLSDNFAFIPIYGRRRVGKTKLIEEFVKGKKVIFFTAIEGVYSQNLELLSQSIFGSPSAPVFNDFSAALEHIYTIAAKEKIVFVIDEYPYLAQSERSVSSILQHAIDHKFLSTNMLLILSGSSMSFMENQVLGYQSPLYGRRSGQIKLLPESFENSRSYAPLFTAQEQAIMYGVTGGVPKYLSLFNDKNTLDNNMLMQFFNKDSFLYEETDNLLKQELSEPAFYKAIITAIANGGSQMKDIAGKTGKDSGVCSMYIKPLMELGIVKRQIPIMDKTQSKKSIYKISDGMFRFWYRFVYGNTSLINIGQGEFVYERIKEQIPAFMGEVFEDICTQYMWSNYNELPVKFQNIGRWWGNNPIRKRQQELDFIAYDDTSKSAIFGECKWRNEKVSEDIIDELITKSEMFGFKEKYYQVFSKSGFTASAKKRANDKIMLTEFAEMF